MVFLTLGHAKVAVLKREREKLIVIAGPFNRMVHKNGDWSRKRWLKIQSEGFQSWLFFQNYRVLKPNSTKPLKD